MDGLSSPAHTVEPARVKRLVHATRVRAIIALIGVAMATAAACAGDSPGIGGPAGGGTFGNIGGLLGGYSGTGFTAFGMTLDPQFNYLYFNETQAEGPWDCDTDGYCSVAGLKSAFGTLVETDSFMVVATANVDHNGDRVVRNSGVQTKTITIANPSQYSAVRVSFQFVFASARKNTTHNDSAIVRLKAGTDSVTLFKVTATDVKAAGPYPPRTGGCGSASLISGRPITYASCSSWVTITADLTPYKTRTFALQFIAAEGGQSSTDHVDEPVAFLFRKVAIEGAK
jgi:hypothetical protein